MAYTVVLRPAAAKDLKQLPKPAQRRVGEAIDGLAKDPRPQGCEQLKGTEGFLRIRVGEYRIIYVVESRKIIVLVLRIGHRKDVYRMLKR